MKFITVTTTKGMARVNIEKITCFYPTSATAAMKGFRSILEFGGENTGIATTSTVEEIEGLITRALATPVNFPR